MKFNRDRAANAVAHVFTGEIFSAEFVDAFEHAFAEGRQMGTTVVGELTVYEAEIRFAVGPGVGEGELDFIGAFVKDVVMRFFFANFGGEQIFQARF